MGILDLCVAITHRSLSPLILTALQINKAQFPGSILVFPCAFERHWCLSVFWDLLCSCRHHCIYIFRLSRAFLLEARDAARARRVASARVVMSLLLTDTVIWGKKIRTTEGETIIKQTYSGILLKKNCFNALLNGISHQNSHNFNND